MKLGFATQQNKKDQSRKATLAFAWSDNFKDGVESPQGAN